jgi:hypothetical protein
MIMELKRQERLAIESDQVRKASVDLVSGPASEPIFLFHCLGSDQGNYVEMLE